LDVFSYISTEFRTHHPQRSLRAKNDEHYSSRNLGSTACTARLDGPDCAGEVVARTSA
jgi:hypothetical protein